MNDLILQFEEAGDSDRLKPFLAKVFTIRRSNGVHQNREEFLRDIPNNAKLGRDTENPQVLLTDDCILFTCIVSTTLNTDGKPTPGRFRNIRVFIQEDGE
jgi:hypothetical protein